MVRDGTVRLERERTTRGRMGRSTAERSEAWCSGRKVESGEGEWRHRGGGERQR